MRRQLSTALLLCTSVFALGAGTWSCGLDDAPKSKLGVPPGATPGTTVTTSLSPAQQEELAALQAQLDEVKGLDAAGFASKYKVPFVTDLGYDPMTAQGLDRIQASSLALTANEQTALGTRGFVTTARKQYPSSTATRRSTPKTCRSTSRPTRSSTPFTSRSSRS